MTWPRSLRAPARAWSCGSRPIRSRTSPSTSSRRWVWSPTATAAQPKLERRNALLALRFRAGILPERAVNALAGLLQTAVSAPDVIAALAALVACDVWLGTSHGVSSGLQTLLQSPALGLILVALVILSLAFHECGHAAACRYGGARPGRIGIGIYLVWPVFYTDVTDSWRLSKPGRLRTDLGGVYFNVLFALTAAGAFLATSYQATADRRRQPATAAPRPVRAMGPARRLPHRQRPDRRFGPVRSDQAGDRQHAPRPAIATRASASSNHGRAPPSRSGS